MARYRDNVATNKTRVQGVTGDQTITSVASSVLRRIVVANADGAAQTLTVKDGSTTQVVLRVPAGTSQSIEFSVTFTGSIVVNPSSANIDALVLWD